MRRLSAEVGDPDVPQLGLLDLLLSVSLPAHHHEIGGTRDLLDFILRVLELEIRPLSGGSPPIVVYE